MGSDFVSGESWGADDPYILTRMDFDGLMAWMHDYCNAKVGRQKRPTILKSTVIGRARSILGLRRFRQTKLLQRC